ncbi:MAG: hypothetical protein JSS35_03985 [Proteobacteria bacterium]|nr:hypothetical protein [Pseudomonadota bacterium]
MHGSVIPALIVPLTTTTISISAVLAGWWALSAQRARARRAIEARLAALEESPVEIIARPRFGAWWGTSGLTGGAVLYRVVARTAAGKLNTYEWAYDLVPGAGLRSGGLKTFAHGIWIPVA